MAQNQQQFDFLGLGNFFDRLFRSPLFGGPRRSSAPPPSSQTSTLVAGAGFNRPEPDAEPGITPLATGTQFTGVGGRLMEIVEGGNMASVRQPSIQTSRSSGTGTRRAPFEQVSPNVFRTTRLPNPSAGRGTGKHGPANVAAITLGTDEKPFEFSIAAETPTGRGIDQVLFGLRSGIPLETITAALGVDPAEKPQDFITALKDLWEQSLAVSLGDPIAASVVFQLALEPDTTEEEPDLDALFQQLFGVGGNEAAAPTGQEDDPADFFLDPSLLKQPFGFNF